MVAKSVSIDWKFQPCSKGCKGDDDDRISQLPDDILVAILCLLSVKDAARTSVLSSRWISLWKHTSSLDFDAEEAMNKVGRRNKFLINERGKYVKCVNSVLRSHKSVTLKEFRICFDFSKSATKTMTKWLKYAFAKQVQRLEFDLSPACMSRSCLPEFNYVFPQELLTESSGGGSPSNTCINHHLRTHFDFKNLKVLSLKFVTVTREAIEYFLNNHLKGGTELSKFPEMPRLKKLVIKCYASPDESLLGVTSLITASPNLQKFVFKLNWLELSRSGREVESIVTCPHEHLKVVKFCGYYGRSSDVEFIRYFLDNCVVLEKVIIDPHYLARAPVGPAELAEEITARRCAKQQLEARVRVPQHIELVIL